MNLPDPLYRAAKLRAAQEGRTVTSLVEEALRNVLDEPPRTDAYRVRPLRGGMIAPELDLSDNAAVRDLLDEAGQ